MLESVSWILTVIAIYGTYLNINKNVRGFYFWLVSNSAFSSINFVEGHFAQGFLFGIYAVLAIIGIQRWNEST